MKARDLVRPPTDTWVVAIHNSEGDLSPSGAGAVIGSRRILTCAHNVIAEDGAVNLPLWVGFPTSEISGQRRRVVEVILPAVPLVDDIAVLVLDEPVPLGVGVAALRRPAPSELVGSRWWAFGFPNGDPVGDSAQGLVKGSLGGGWIRLDVASRDRVAFGFSGAGVWSPDYAAVVGIITHANAQGDARAVTLYQADRCLPTGSLELPASTEAAGWALARDPEASRHWLPRARGVAIDSEQGYRFRGRTVALELITDWLTRPTPDRRVLVVTGSPGVGKSAVLGRVVTTADAGSHGLLPADDTAVRARVGSVACAVHASGKDSLEVAAEIARAGSARLPDRAQDIAPALRHALSESGRRHFNVIIDALDEAASPADARSIIHKIVLPLAETCADVGVQVIVGSRGHDDDGYLLGSFGEALTVVDLDDPQYFAEADLAAYAKANLQLSGDERPDSPYRDDAVASVLAARIAELADRNFLIGGLVARAHGLHDRQAVDPERLSFTATVDSALNAFLARISPASQVPPKTALIALALAEAPGWPIEMWRLAIEAMSGEQITGQQLSQFARSTAANFLIESGANGAVFRLFHQALNDALLHERSRIVPGQEDQRAVYRAFFDYGRRQTWSRAPAYLLRSLGNHAVSAGMIDELLADDSYLLNADLRRLMPLADQAISRPARLSARLMRLTPQAVKADAATRAGLFGVTSALENLGRNYADPSAPYRATWASVIPHAERAVLDDHTGEVSGVCAFTMNSRVRLATVGKDATVRTWDPATGEPLSAMTGHTGWIRAICAFHLDDRVLLATAGDDQHVRTWDPGTGQPLSAMAGHTDWIRAICAFDLDGQVVLATAGDDGTIRTWDLAADRPRSSFESATSVAGSGRLAGKEAIYALCAVVVDEQVLLASAGADLTIRIWDPATGRLRFALTADTPADDGIRGLCAFSLAGQVVLASAHGNGTIRVWDLSTRQQRAALQGHTGVVRSVSPFILSEQTLLASAGGDGTVRIWDPATGHLQAALEGHSGWVNAVCTFPFDAQVLLASAGGDGTVRIWDPPIGSQRPAMRSAAGSVRGICEFTLAGQSRLASAAVDGSIRIWDPSTGQQQATLEGHDSASGVCAWTVDGQARLASAGEDGTVRIWDPATGKMLRVLQAHDSLVNGVCAFALNGEARLASASADRVARIWDPATGQLKTALEGHAGAVNSLCAFSSGGQVLLATASADGAVRIWDPATSRLKKVLEGHAGGVNSVCAFSSGGHMLLASAGADHTVRIWDTTDGLLAVLSGHTDWVTGICTLTRGDRSLLASASLDRTVRVFDPETGERLADIPVHHAAQAICQAGQLLVIGLSAGLIAIDLAMAWLL